MPTVGATLAAERVRQQLTLEDIARVLKLSPRALAAIEADDLERLPGLLFARNFVRQYAGTLGLNAEALVRQLENEQGVPSFATAARPPESAESFVPNVRPVGLRRAVSGDLISALVSLVVTAAICAGLYWGYGYWRDRSSSAALSPHTPSHSSREKQPASETAATPRKAEPVSATAALPPVSPAPGKIHVEVAATEACWTRIQSDGAVVFAGTLNPGESKTVEGESAIAIRAGNAGALNIQLNGSPIGPVGPSGQIRVVTLSSSGVQVRTPNPDFVSEF